MKLSLSNLRKIIKESILLLENTAPDPSVTNGIFQAIVKSNFWQMPHSEDSVDLVDKATFSTPAVEVLMDALNDAAARLGTDLYFILSVTDLETYTLGPDDQYGGYPNGWLMRGQYRGPEKGKHIVWLEFRPYSDEYDMDDLDTNELSKIISRTINHELVHYNQLKKQAKSKNISEEDAWEELMNDPKQLSKSGKYGDYLSLHNEIDAFAYEAAEELLDKYTTEEVLQMLRSGSNEASRILSDYASFLKDDTKSLQKFLKKVYTNVEKISELGVE
tara:strand:- start:2143 stop:2967 length:825 start_codon:yes stop_codon:yes gene_type:complete